MTFVNLAYVLTIAGGAVLGGIVATLAFFLIL